MNDTAAAAATSIVTATSRAYGRHSSESDVDTPPKVEAPPLFEASPKGFICIFACFVIQLLALESERTESNTNSFLGSPTVDEERMSSGSDQCFLFISELRYCGPRDRKDI